MPNKCERCLNSRVICSESGFHSICTLPPKKLAKCLIGKENHFKEDLSSVRDSKWFEEGSNNAEEM